MNRISEVSECALIGRINRKLAHEAWPLLRLRTSRGARLEQTVGKYYLLDQYKNMVVDTDLDLEELARKLGVIRELESLAREDKVDEPS